MYRLDTVHFVTERQTDDIMITIADHSYRMAVRSAKNYASIEHADIGYL